MSLDMLINHLQFNRRDVQNAYYHLLTLRQAMIIAKESNKDIPSEVILEQLGSALFLLEGVVEGRASS